MGYSCNGCVIGFSGWLVIPLNLCTGAGWGLTLALLSFALFLPPPLHTSHYCCLLLLLLLYFPIAVLFSSLSPFLLSLELLYHQRFVHLLPLPPPLSYHHVIIFLLSFSLSKNLPLPLPWHYYLLFHHLIFLLFYNIVFSSFSNSL